MLWFILGSACSAALVDLRDIDAGGPPHARAISARWVLARFDVRFRRHAPGVDRSWSERTA